MRAFFPALCVLPSLFSLPTNPNVVSGTLKTLASEYICSDRTVLQWQDFSIGVDESLRFTLPSKDAAVLNQVASLAQINGSLFSNGQVYFSAPGGIVIGRDAVIDVSSLLLTTLQLDADAFINGRDFALLKTSDGALIQQGTLIAREGSVFLIAPRIENGGKVEADEIVLIASLEALIQADGRGLLYIKPDLSTGEGAVRHLEQGVLLSRDGGKIYLNGSQIDIVGSIQGGDVSLEAAKIGLSPTAKIETSGNISIIADEEQYLGGQIDGKNVSIQMPGKTPIHLLGEIKGETVQIKAPNIIQHRAISAKEVTVQTTISYMNVSQSSVIAEEKISFSGAESSTFFASGTLSAGSRNGGTIRIEAANISMAGAKIHADGNSGGEIVIGTKEFTKSITINGSTKISAKGIEGAGGTVHVISSKDVEQYGSVVVDGKTRGGEIEISGENVSLSQDNRLSALGERAGRIYFDPKNITIAASPTGVYPQYELIDPTPSLGTGFGTVVSVLSTGNVVVTKPNYNPGGATNTGAVYLYDGLTAELISTLTGSTANDLVSDGGITALTGNGNYVVRSANWDIPGGAANVGAATWGSGTTGVAGTVSEINSLIGSTATEIGRASCRERV